jgi:hypothetical protein
MTRYEKVKNMTIEEMAEIIYKHTDYETCTGICSLLQHWEVDKKIEAGDCIVCCIDWLNREI